MLGALAPRRARENIAVLVMPATTAMSKPNNMPTQLATMTPPRCAGARMDFTSMFVLRVDACRKDVKKSTVKCQRCHMSSLDRRAETLNLRSRVSRAVGMSCSLPHAVMVRAGRYLVLDGKFWSVQRHFSG